MKHKRLIIWIMIGLLVVFCPRNSYALEGISESEIVTLEKCVDGDTATFKDQSGTTFKTRFLAIDTPETVHPTKEVELYGKEASTYTCTQLTNATEIKLEYDEGSSKVDKYGRRLAWIYVDQVLLQEKLIEQGYAKVAYLYGDYKYTELLQKKEEEAKEKKLGLWAQEEKKQEEKEEPKKETKKKASKKETKKNWLQELVDYALGEIFKYIDNLLEKIVKFIESML